uniref:Uncharacterized protein n=1 Tax=Avena sativa TaxID=4498 RepID=A0ACD5VCW5_AVESA
MARGGGDTPPAREGKRGRRTDSEGCSSRNGSMGGHGGTESLPDAVEEEDSRELLAGSDDTNGSGAAVAANPGHGSPDDPTPPSAPHQNGIISVAHTPNIPPRFEGLVRNITSISTYATKGNSYACGLDQMNFFLNWSKSERAFFFEWSDENMEMIWWMHNLQKGEFFKFTVNAAFSQNMDDINVERAAVAFSRGFIGDNEHWSGVKDMLLNMFGSFEDDGLKDYDYLYVFTRVGDSIYFRNYKIISFPKADDASSGLVLTEINTFFCLKLIIDQTTPKSSDIGQHHTKNETSAELNFCPVIAYLSNRQMGCCLSHSVDFSGKTYSIFLENGPYVSSVENLEGFNRSLAEIVVKEPLLKIKNIIGSVTNKTCCFARQRCKLILKSLFAQFAMLFESRKCISGSISMHNVLVRGSEVKLYGLDVTDYDEELAKANVGLLVKMVRNCFPDHEIPIDLSELLDDLEKDPLNEIRTAKDDCSLLKAEKRRSLLINIYSEYITNVEAKSSGSDQISGESKKIDEYSFFDGCPDAGDWELIMKDNEYMVQVCDVEESSENGEETDAGNQKLNDSVKKRMKKKQRMRKSIKRMMKKRKQEPNKGKLQFSAKRNFEVRMPEMASKDGILPFRLGIADYILTAYFPRFLRFVQRRMREVKAQKEKFKKTQSYSRG